MKTNVKYAADMFMIMITAGMVMFLISAIADEPFLYTPIGEGYGTLSLVEGEAIDVPSKSMPLTMEPVDDTPIQLLRPGEGHDRLELSETALEKLAALEEPVSIVGIVGPYHGGKSFLMNVLLNSTHGFSVGIKPEPETRGIWIRIVSKKRLTGVDGSQVIFLDTEGFYGERATRLYDARIFAVATLLSSHLVYNTVRTLGDQQSVSALADLAKQAQVFNLQNWLHSGEVSSDLPLLSGSVSPSLLLKTLDFPPLTWVVQGFDMDLDPSHSPMDYLQRYLSAFSQTGDRTLDTLFTKGISCYALRTPTDLNLLRELYGSKVLAADAELFGRLHPGYISELDILQKGVFGNLTAKGGGKLTGSAIATLLPLLVHYVNEDFPLHAERKLRDVLMDIIVDGAFSGGVEYFKKCMHETSLIDSVVSSKRGRKPGRLASDMVSMSDLANSALTVEELEAVMKCAEQRAITYCKQRCVGVPQDLVTMSCDAQLGTKISKLKPYFREENERKVREVLVRLGEGLHATAGKKILELKLPMADNDLQKICNNIIGEAIHGYEALVGPHKGTQLYHEARVRMQDDIQGKCEKVARINAEKISSIFAAAKAVFRSEYEHGFLSRIRASDVQSGNKLPSTVEDSLKDVIGKPLSQNQLDEIHVSNAKLAAIAYEKGVKDALPWMGAGREIYDFHHFQCLQWIKQRVSEIQAYNNMLIRGFAEKSVAALSLQYKTELSNITPFPDNDEMVSEKAVQIAKQLMQEYLSITRDYASLPVIEERRKELARSMESLMAHLLKKNTALMAAFCYDPLMDAYKELKMQDCERTFQNMWVSRSFWSPKCLWPGPKYIFGFKYAAYKAAFRHLEQAQTSAYEGAQQNHEIAKGVLLSPSTRNKVIQAWIEHDLAAYANIVLVNFSILVACTVVFVTMFLWVSRKVLQFSNIQRKSYESDDQSYWTPQGNSFQMKTEHRASGYYRR